MPIRPDLIRNAVAIAEAQTRLLRTPVTHIPVIGRDEFGPVFGDPTELADEQAPLVEFKGEGIATAQGTEAQSKSKLTFFWPINVTDRDKFIVREVDGELNVLRVDALLDPNKEPYMVEVWLGDRGQGGT